MATETKKDPKADGQPLFRGEAKKRAIKEEFLRTKFPAGTIFRRDRRKYANGNFYSKGELSPPLKRAGVPPGPGWVLHSQPSEDDVDPDLRGNTMSEIQGEKASKPTGA